MISVTFITNANKTVTAPDNSNLLRVSLREKGGIPVEEGTHMKMWGDPHKASPYLNWWNMGFEAGYRGKAKPAAT